MKKFILGTMIASVLSLSFTTQKENYDFLNSVSTENLATSNKANPAEQQITVVVGAVLFVTAFTCPTWAASTVDASADKNSLSFANRHDNISEEKLLYNLD